MSRTDIGRPETGEIAVKVINHDGDEVLKVYEACRSWVTYASDGSRRAP